MSTARLLFAGGQSKDGEVAADWATGRRFGGRSGVRFGVAWHGSGHLDTPPAGIIEGSTGPAPRAGNLGQSCLC
jgi:hypothetical protein